ncbi:MAG: OmpA family protein [Sedimentisphaerales bacterium]|nr:OmpA family protein [Sedimentisphaerales bacterium]
MHSVLRKTMVVVVGLLVISVLTGCTNWKKKYTGLNVEHENLKGRYQMSLAEKNALAQKVAEDQRMIDDLQKQIAEGQKPGAATGFGDEFPVAFDAAAGTITVTLPDAILFDSGKADLKKSTGLDGVLAVIKEKYTGKMIDVIGHTDNDPIKKSKWKDNWELSAQRSLSVTRYFAGHGIPDSDLRAIGRGESDPVASNKTSAGKGKNRRVEIVVHIRSQEAAAKLKAVQQEEQPK